MSNEGETSRAMIQILPDRQHPTLGAVGGWKGTVLRSFTAGGVAYLDVEISSKTIAGLSREERARYYAHKLVFTRIRVAERDTEPLPVPLVRVERADIVGQTQREWYNDVGEQEQDPTKFVADRTATQHVDVGRREAIRSLVGVGAFLVIMLAVMQRDCSRDSSGTGSWGRSGGFSS